jgi:hypothetical protein
MTESEWLTSQDGVEMLDYLRRSGRAGPRKLRLLACGCARSQPHLLIDPRLRRAVEVAEAYADGAGSAAELREAEVSALEVANAAERAAGLAFEEARGKLRKYVKEALAVAATTQVVARACGTGMAFRHSGLVDGFEEIDDAGLAHCRFTFETLYRAQHDLVRCIFGNPFTAPPHLDPAWLRWQDATVLRMATAIYEDRAFDRMSVLADALLDAGCDDEAVLAHCREQGAVHARGCWVIDLVLGRQ